MRLKIKFTSDSPFGDYRKGDIGVVDGYVRGGDDVPCAVIIKENGTFVMANLNQIVLIEKGGEEC